MDKPHYSLFAKTIQKIVSTRPGSFVSSHLQRPLDLFIYQRSKGKLSYVRLGELPLVVVTTTGRKSGQPRTVPLLPIYDRENPAVFAVVASNWGKKNHPAWYYNIKACPVVTCSIEGREREYAAHEAEGEEYERFWTYAGEVYSGYPKYKQRASHRRIPILVMEPVGG